MTDEQLLGMRFCDLKLKIERTPLARRVRRLYRELDKRQIRFRPHVWLSEEWFSPDGVPGIAVPFYLAHPRLERLERRMMRTVEGGSAESAMRILRHEAGHAIDTAYRLRRRKSWREVFGPASLPYPDTYRARPGSRRYVQHLGEWYAQSHPCEDFAETFAVWLTPESDWKTRYAGWPAIRKLNYMDELMRSLAGKQPLLDKFEEVDPLRRLNRTLRHHYKKKRAHYGVDHPAFYDRDLRKLFSDASEHAAHMTAAQFLGRYRRQLRKVVADWTGIYQYTIDRVLEDIIVRCRELKLRLAMPEQEALQEFTVLLTVQVMNYLHSGRHRIAL
jgi:hypothetical protein